MSFIPKDEVKDSGRKLPEFAEHYANSAERWWQAVLSKDETSRKTLNDHIEGLLKSLGPLESFSPSYTGYLATCIADCDQYVDRENMMAEERESHRQFTFGMVAFCLNDAEKKTGYCFVL